MENTKWPQVSDPLPLMHPSTEPLLLPDSLADSERSLWALWPRWQSPRLGKRVIGPGLIGSCNSPRDWSVSKLGLGRRSLGQNPFCEVTLRPREESSLNPPLYAREALAPQSQEAKALASAEHRTSLTFLQGPRLWAADMGPKKSGCSSAWPRKLALFQLSRVLVGAIGCQVWTPLT